MKRKLFGISATLAVLLAFGLVLASCGGDDDDDGGGGGGGGGGIPSALVGTWAGTGNSFEITADGHFIMGPQTFDVSVSGATVTVTLSSNPMATFDYEIDGDGKLVISNGEGNLGPGLEGSSPFTKG